MAAGRPSTYTPYIAEQICNRLIDGESLANICRDESMPSATTVFNWLHEHSEFLDNYTRAREAQAEKLADELIEIADDDSRDAVKDLGAIERARLKIETRKWVASKLRPKKYGSFKSVELKGELELPAADLSHLTFEQLYELKHGRKPE